jgi:hypothetical protein
MLPPFIIEQIRKKERYQYERQQPQLELPLPVAPWADPGFEPTPKSDSGDRGVLIIEVL